MRPLAVALALALAGCGGREGEAPPVAAVAGAPTRIEPTPSLSVGVLEGDPAQIFDRVVTPFLTANGDLAVPTQGSRTIRVFNGDGALVREYGAGGSGPGEFAWLRSAWSRGDTLEAFDWQLQRITRFLPGGIVEVVRIRGAPVRMERSLGPFGDGWALSAIDRPVFGARDSMSVHLVARDGGYAARLARTVGMRRFQFREARFSGPHPLSPAALMAVRGDELYVAETTTPLISVFDAAGAPVRAIDVPLDPPRLTAGLHREVLDSAVARAAEGDRAALRGRLDLFPAPDRLSAVWHLIVDELGFVWVRAYEPLAHALALEGRPGRPGPGGEWVVLSGDATVVGSVRAPEELELVQIAADAVVGIRRDELGVESVRVHALERR